MRPRQKTHIGNKAWSCSHWDVCTLVPRFMCGFVGLSGERVCPCFPPHVDDDDDDSAQRSQDPTSRADIDRKRACMYLLYPFSKIFSFLFTAVNFVFQHRDEFKTLDYQRIYDSMAKPAFVFDGRGVVDIEALRAIGFEVYCIGKSRPKYSPDSPK